MEITKPRSGTEMSKMNTEKKLVSRKLLLNCETLRSLSAQGIEEVAGGYQNGCFTRAGGSCPTTG
jgi:hypothetical protein